MAEHPSRTIEVREDPSRPAGVALIALAPAVDDETPTANAVSIQRTNAEGPNLGPSGWQPAPHRFVPQKVEAGDGETLLVFGPEVTAHVSLDERVTVAVPSQSARATIYWPEIAAAPSGGRLSLGIERPADAQTVPPPVARRTAPTEIRPREEVLEPPPPPPAANPPVQTTGRPRTLIFSGLGLVVALLAALAAWFLLSPQDQVASVEPTDEPAPAVTAPTSEEEPEPEAPPADGPSFAERYQALVEQGGRKAELLALGEEAIAAGEAEIGFRAVSVSSDRGSAEAMLQIARWYDPSVGGFAEVTPNADIAASYYRSAAELGAAEAASGVAALCEAADPDEPAFATFNDELHCADAPSEGVR